MLKCTVLALGWRMVSKTVWVIGLILFPVSPWYLGDENIHWDHDPCSSRSWRKNVFCLYLSHLWTDLAQIFTVAWLWDQPSIHKLRSWISLQKSPFPLYPGCQWLQIWTWLGQTRLLWKFQLNRSNGSGDMADFVIQRVTYWAALRLASHWLRGILERKFDEKNFSLKGMEPWENRKKPQKPAF